MSLITAALKPRSVLVATDFSGASEKALRHSLALARFYGSRFCLAHVVGSLGLRIAGPEAIAECEQLVLREAAQLQASLVRTGALQGVEHKFVVRQGEVWPELREIIREERSDLVVVGTHGRHGLAKLFLGSSAEQILRHADCPVVTLGPHSIEHPWIGTSSKQRTFLFATDFGQASLHGLPQAVAVANHFEAKLVFLHIIPAHPQQSQKDARRRAVERLAELARDATLDVKPECQVEFESKQPISEWILKAAGKLRADLIIMGLHDCAHSGAISHLNWTTLYDVVCYSASPVMSVNYPSRNRGIRPTQAELTVSFLSPADLIRIRGLGVKW